MKKFSPIFLLILLSVATRVGASGKRDELTIIRWNLVKNSVEAWASFRNQTIKFKREQGQIKATSMFRNDSSRWLCKEVSLTLSLDESETIKYETMHVPKERSRQVQTKTEEKDIQFLLDAIAEYRRMEAEAEPETEEEGEQ